MARFFSHIFFVLFICQASFAGVLMQGFYWDAPSTPDQAWWDRLAQESQALSENGFTAIWLPPVLKGASGGYSNGYDPYDDYDMGSKDQKGTYGTHWGSREQLARTVAVLRANGLDVYFDNVLGHRSGDPGDLNFSYQDAFGELGKGRFPKGPSDFAGNNDFGRQLNYFNPTTRDHLIQAGDWLINALGVQGQRIDMAKNVHPEFLKGYLDYGAMAGKFVVSEYWSENIQELEHYLYDMNQRVSVFDFPLWGNLKDLSNGGGFYDLSRLPSVSFASRYPSHAVTFVENHDTDRGYPTLQNKHLGYAYILTTEGYPSVFWKDYFVYGLKSIIDPLVWIHEKFANGSTVWRYTAPDLLVYERLNSSGLLVGLNDNPQAYQSQWVQTQFGGFTELHDYTGNGPDLRTEADGRVEIKVPPNSYVAYSRAGFHQRNELQSYRVEQQFAGAADLDIRPAETKRKNTVGRIWIAPNTEIQWSLFLETPGISKASPADLKAVLFLKNPQNQQVKEFAVSLQDLSGSGEAWASSEGWYEFEIKLETSDKNLTELSYWLDVSYQGPKKPNF